MLFWGICGSLVKNAPNKSKNWASFHHTGPSRAVPITLGLHRVKMTEFSLEAGRRMFRPFGRRARTVTLAVLNKKRTRFNVCRPGYKHCAQFSIATKSVHWNKLLHNRPSRARNFYTGRRGRTAFVDDSSHSDTLTCLSLIHI